MGVIKKIVKCMSSKTTHHIAAIRIIQHQPEKHILIGFYYNYKIVIAPAGEKAQGLSMRIHSPGDDSLEGVVRDNTILKRNFDRGIIDAVVFIKQHFSRI